MPRADLYAQGLALPRLGSFQDEVLRELDDRKRNLRMAEVGLFVRTLILLLADKRDLPKIKKIEEWLDLYSAELYQDVYTPEWALEERRSLQRKRAEERKAAEDKARLLSKVDSFG